MKIEKVKLKDLIPPSYNPRDITPEAMESLKKSITEFGYIDPLIVNKHNMHIVGGNQRYEALKQLDIQEVEVSYVDIEDINKEKALNIRLNNSSGEWNEIKLNNILEELKIENVDISLTGFEDIKIQTYEDINFNDNSLFETDYEDDITEYTPSQAETDFENVDDLYETSDDNSEDYWELNYTLRFDNPKDDSYFYEFIGKLKENSNGTISDALLEYLDKNVVEKTNLLPFKSDFEIIFKSKEDKQKFMGYLQTLKNRYPTSKYPLLNFIKEFEK